MLVTVSTAGASASLRVHVWRKLRGLGGLYLQQSVCLLPDVPPVRRQVLRLLDRVDRDGGTGRLLHIQLTDPTERGEVIAAFQAARDEEYDEVLERLPEFFAELERETARGRVTYAEVEENEADLARYRDWMKKIAARDYFEAPRGEVARAELARAEAVFAAFEAAALAAEEPATGSAVPPATTGGLKRLRAVEEDS
ncbi:hypothetical protein GCM10029978_007980 [Actinoallomurus acanthiterrae]